MEPQTYRDETGFSLIELMVVVLIIAILIAVAVPTLLGFRERAEDSGAKTAAGIAMRTGRGLLERDDYASLTQAGLSSSEPQLTWVDGGTSSTGPTVVSQDVPDRATVAKTFVVAVYSLSGKCFFARDVSDQGTSYGILDPSTPAQCQAGNEAAVSFGPAW